MKNTLIMLLLLSFIWSMSITCRKNGIDSSETLVTLPETDNPTLLNQWAVTRFDLLKLRQEPLAGSKIINYIPLGAVVEIQKKNNKLQTFDTFENYWYLINYDGEVGWIFGAYLELFNSRGEAFDRAFVITEE
jgi:hypothetical protein